jgi:hypothetical protein
MNVVIVVVMDQLMHVGMNPLYVILQIAQIIQMLAQ